MNPYAELSAENQRLLEAYVKARREQGATDGELISELAKAIHRPRKRASAIDLALAHPGQQVVMDDRGVTKGRDFSGAGPTVGSTTTKAQADKIAKSLFDPVARATREGEAAGEAVLRKSREEEWDALDQHDLTSKVRRRHAQFKQEGRVRDQP